jgi:hypothetical protein
MYQYTKRQLSVLIDQADRHHGSIAALARHLGLSSSTGLWRASKCRSTEAAFPPAIAVLLGLRELPNQYAVYESAVDVRVKVGLPVEKAVA